VRVVLDDGGTLGVMDTRDAIQEARSRGLDLVEIAPGAQPPVAKIIDYGKFLYEQKKKQHEAKKRQVTVQVKEIKFRPGTDDHDYEYRRENARKWLTEGDKVRAAIAFRGREMSHRELGAKILKRLTEELAEFGDVEVAPKMEGYQMFTILSPKKGLSQKKEKEHISVAPDTAEVAEKSEKPRREQRQGESAPKEEPKADDEIF
jgi:translation initiation factor IF-3